MSAKGSNAAQDSFDLAPGEVVGGKFRIVEAMAEGGMGKIYRAEQVPLGRAVALKVLLSRVVGDNDPQFQKRFFLEASILSKLQNPHIVTLYDYGKIEGSSVERYFMAMEFLHGQTLQARIREKGTLALQEVFRIFRQTARGLREAHKHDIVHRDLKPSNIMLVPDDEGNEVVKILDFGIGKVVSDQPSPDDLTHEGAILGSPRYVSPEQVAEGRVDARADIYSLGVMLYEVLCGKVPFEGNTNIAIMMAHCNEPVPPMSVRNPTALVPEELEHLARACLEKDPAKRPQTIEAFARALSLCEEQILGIPVSGGGISGTSSASGNLMRRPPPTSGPFAKVGLITGTGSTTASALRADEALSPSAPAPKSRAVPVALVLGVLAALVAVFLIARPKAPPAPPAAVASAAPAPPLAPTTFMLLVDSIPPAAEVVDGDTVLGTTPLSLPVTHESVKASPRKYVVRLTGYVPYTFYQADSDATVKVFATLSAEAQPAAAAQAAAPRARQGAAAKAQAPAPVAAPPAAPPRKSGSDLDIQMTR
jgi:serine/threonine-protein kinase